MSSFRLLYVKSKTSNTGNAPNPRGSVLRRLIDTFNIRNLGMDDNDNGSSSMWLLEKLSISKFERFAIEAGTTKVEEYMYYTTEK